MDKEFLEDYDGEERDRREKYEKWFLEGGNGPDPLVQRLIKPQEPLVRSSTSASLKSIWAQIPFSGSLILTLPNCSGEQFEEAFHIRVREVPELADFIRETGRLQITLSQRPLDYLGLDYLDPIFKELRPMCEFGIPTEAIFSTKDINTYFNEYASLCAISFYDFLHTFMQTEAYPIRAFFNATNTFYDSYAYLRALGYETITKELENRLVDDPASALLLSIACRHFITDPLVASMTKSINYSFDSLNLLQMIPEYCDTYLQKIQFPCEIGKFLTKNLTHYPESFVACKELIAHYEGTDLIKVAAALNQGIREAKPDLINESKTDLSTILRELWEDKSLRRKVDGLKVGIPVSIAAVGSVAFGPIGGIGGFLAGLGFSVGERILDIKGSTLSEAVARLLSPNYQANIYDFKKKYRLG